MPARSALPTSLRNGLLLGAAVLALLAPAPGSAPIRAAASAVPGDATTTTAAATTAPIAPPRLAAFGAEPASEDVRLVADWATDSGDHQGLHFVILDKRQAKVFLFTPDGRLRAASPVLLGSAAGDHTVDGIGSRPIAEVRPEERTTPAGRFVAQPGRNTTPEDVVWVDYGAAVSMHRVRATNPAERRLERLASPDPAERRISYGCINLPVAFFEQYIWPVFQHSYGVVYVLPEVMSLEQAFPLLYDPRDPIARLVASTER